MRASEIMDITIKAEKRDGYHLITVGGDVSIETSYLLDKKISELASDGNDNFIIDLSGVHMLDSRGAGTLVKINYYARVFFVDLPVQVREVVERLMLLEKFRVCRTIQDAEKRL